MQRPRANTVKKNPSFITGEESEYQEYAQTIKKFDSSQLLKNQSYLKEKLLKNQGFVKDCFEKKDFACLLKIIQTHIATFTELRNEEENLEKKFLLIQKQNRKKMQQIQALKSKKAKLSNQNSRLRSRILSVYEENINKREDLPVLQDSHGLISNFPNSQFQNPTMFSDFGEVVKAQKANPHIVNKYWNDPSSRKIQSSKEVIESEIYSTLRLGKQFWNNKRSSSQPKKEVELPQIKEAWGPMIPKTATKVAKNLFPEGKSDGLGNPEALLKNIQKLPNELKSKGSFDSKNLINPHPEDEFDFPEEFSDKFQKKEYEYFNNAIKLKNRLSKK